MKHEKINDALNEISDAHIAEAAKPKKRRKLYWLGAIAAVLAIVLSLEPLANIFLVQANAISVASGSRQTEPNRNDHDDPSWDIWREERAQREANTDAALAQLQPFFTESAARFLSGTDGANRIYSPVNVYIGLAMMAELTAGDSRQQILDLLNAGELETLRTQVSAVWETCYNDSNDKILLANSLWLDKGLEYSQDIMDALAYHYYASVYMDDLGSPKANLAIESWLNSNTGGLLKDAANGVSLDPETVLALYSTIYFYSKWSDEFNAANNTADTFHALSGDITAEFMNQKKMQSDYCWGDSFGAVSKYLKNGSQMWFILPDEDKTVDDVLAEGQFMEMVTAGYDPETYEAIWTNQKYMYVNLSVPKFDVSSQVDLKDGLMELGVTDIFNEAYADFTAITDDSPVFITAANQAARVKIDEKGVEAAAYIEFPGAGAAPPPEEIIDFVLDRPFIFVISRANLPLFVGVVNEP